MEKLSFSSLFRFIFHCFLPLTFLLPPSHPINLPSLLLSPSSSLSTLPFFNISFLVPYFFSVPFSRLSHSLLLPFPLPPRPLSFIHFSFPLFLPLPPPALSLTLPPSPSSSPFPLLIPLHPSLTIWTLALIFVNTIRSWRPFRIVARGFVLAFHAEYAVDHATGAHNFSHPGKDAVPETGHLTVCISRLKASAVHPCEVRVGRTVLAGHW